MQQAKLITCSRKLEKLKILETTQGQPMDLAHLQEEGN